jgi:uncharacterized membrane protein YgdD (TMEM256/DUF423 family)
MRNCWVAVGAVSALISVAAGAFGAHALRERLSLEEKVIFEIGARYQMYHALAMVAVGILSELRSSRRLAWAGVFFLIGTVVFSGSLYALSLSGLRGFGAITPLGGASLLAGWGMLAAARWRA